MQSLAGNLSQLLPVHCLIDAGWHGFPSFQSSPTMCHALLWEITSSCWVCAKTQTATEFGSLMLEELCGKVSGRLTNPRPSWLPLPSGGSTRRLNLFGVKLGLQGPSLICCSSGHQDSQLLTTPVGCSNWPWNSTRQAQKFDFTF